MKLERWGIQAATVLGCDGNTLTKHWFRWSAEALCRDLNRSAKSAKQGIIYYVVRIK